MYQQKKKAEIFAEFGASATDTGSQKTDRIVQLPHLSFDGALEAKQKDYNTERSLIALVVKKKTSELLEENRHHTLPCDC